MNTKAVAIFSGMRRQCGTCAQWQGDRQLVQAADGHSAVTADSRGGNCKDGAWRNFSTLPRQTCDEYQRWDALLDEPSDPAVLSTISQLHREIRMHSHLAEALPDELREKLDDLMWEIERWHIRLRFTTGSKEEHEREWFFNEFVSGIFDCFYYVGWTRQKPVAEMQWQDIWPL